MTWNIWCFANLTFYQPTPILFIQEVRMRASLVKLSGWPNDLAQNLRCKNNNPNKTVRPSVRSFTNINLFIFIQDKDTQVKSPFITSLLHWSAIFERKKITFFISPPRLIFLWQIIRSNSLSQFHEGIFELMHSLFCKLWHFAQFLSHSK